MITARALDGQCYVVAPNLAFDCTQDTVAFGRSLIVGPMGERLSMCTDDAADEVVIGTLCKKEMAEARERIPLRTEGFHTEYYERWLHDTGELLE